MKHRRLSALSPCAADNFVPWPPLHRANARLFAREYRRAFATLIVFKLFFSFFFFLIFLYFLSLYLFFSSFFTRYRYLERFNRFELSRFDVLLRRSIVSIENYNNEKLLDTLDALRVDNLLTGKIKR